MSGSFALEKSSWSQDDYERLSWSDATVHALAFDSDRRRLLFDVDHVFGFEEPAEGEDSFRFWVAPCTLVFRDVDAIESRLATPDATGLRVAALARSELAPNPDGTPRWRWSLDCDQGDVSFGASGFEQRVRRPPTLEYEPGLSLGARGGVSFALS